MKIIGFHIDMNIAQFRRDYLEKHFRELREFGYNTLVWEVENNIRWESCPDCVSPDAFSKQEFREILDFASGLGFDNIPLLQTLGHAEYVLKHERYVAMREQPDNITLYCPLYPGLEEWFRRWIGEYLELFGNIHYFHLGLDEAYLLGSCPKCRQYVAEHGLGALYFQHVTRILKLIPPHIRPMMWADMILRNPECVNDLDRRVLLLDWNYDGYEGRPDVYLWERDRWLTPDRFSESERRRYGCCLTPRGMEPGRTPNPFFTADYLVKQGFEVVHCPASACGADNIFAPRHILHLRNTFSQFLAGNKHEGTILTSWTVRIHPWELQELSIQVPRFLKNHPQGSWEQYEDAFSQEYFGLKTPLFSRACSLLSEEVPFAQNESLGYDKNACPVLPGQIRYKMQEYRYYSQIPTLTARAERRAKECGEAVKLFDRLVGKVQKHREVMVLYREAAKQLELRARTALFLLQHFDEIIAGRALPTLRRNTAARLLKENQAAKARFIAQYRQGWKENRTQECAAWVYDSILEILITLSRQC